MLVVKAIHTFLAEHGDELQFQAGEEIEVLERDDAFGDGWWRGRNRKGEEGLFPATYIEEEHAQDLDPKPHEPSTAVAAEGAHDPLHPLPESPKGGHTTLLDAASATATSAAAAVTNVMGRTLGEIQDAIESIAKPESEPEDDLGIGQNTRARLAEEAKKANEERERTGASDDVTGLVYSDESDDEEENTSNGQGPKLSTMPALASIPLGAGGLNSTDIPPQTLQPPIQIPSTPPLRENGHASVSTAPPATWSVQDVVNWATAKGFETFICMKFQEHEITGDLLLELDANLLKELDIPQFGKRLRIAQAISELRRPGSTVSVLSQPVSPAVHTNDSSNDSLRKVSAPSASLPPSTAISSLPAADLVRSPSSVHADDTGFSAWSHGRKSSTSQPPSMRAIHEGAPVSESSQPMSASSTASRGTTLATTATTLPNPASKLAISMPSSPVTPSSASTKRESAGSLGHKRGKASVDNKDRLSFFGRSRKPAPATSPSLEQNMTRTGNRVHQVQPATPERRLSSSTGTAVALKQIGAPDHSGYMKKKGETYGWKTRFFVLKGSSMYYMKSETDDHVKGRIDLKGVRVIVDGDANPGSYGFRLVGADKPHIFSSSEQLAIREWMKALMKATIARDYTVPVTSSCNIPTIPLAEAQAMSPRPPSPATRDATQRATRRENTNTLTPHDASVLMSLDTSSGQRRRASQNLAPNRPSRDNRRPSSQAPVQETRSEIYEPLVNWVNEVLPKQYPRAASLPESFISGEVIFLLVRSLSGIEPSPPVPPTAFAPDANGEPGIPGLFAMMDMLIDAGIDTSGVTPGEVRSGDASAIARLVESIQVWSDK